MNEWMNEWHQVIKFFCESHHKGATAFACVIANKPWLTVVSRLTTAYEFFGGLTIIESASDGLARIAQNRLAMAKKMVRLRVLASTLSKNYSWSFAYDGLISSFIMAVRPSRGNDGCMSSCNVVQSSNSVAVTRIEFCRIVRLYANDLHAYSLHR